MKSSEIRSLNGHSIVPESLLKNIAMENALSGSRPASVKQADGLLIVKNGNDIYYIRHDIIMAKAGDVFFMPRKVPADFMLNGEMLVSEEETAI